MIQNIHLGILIFWNEFLRNRNFDNKKRTFYTAGGDADYTEAVEPEGCIKNSWRGWDGTRLLLPYPLPFTLYPTPLLTTLYTQHYPVPKTTLSSLDSDGNESVKIIPTARGAHL